jgi:hypothetical protein
MWILILYIYAGTFAKGDSVTLANVPGFMSEAQCIDAGNRTKPLVANSAKELRFVCVQSGQK